MTLFIQICCYNEEETILSTLRSLPKEIKGIDSIKILIINDGSKDNTYNIVKEYGVDFLFSNKVNMGLAYSFNQGIILSLQNGADIIVHTDADNQYKSDFIIDLVEPILVNNYDLVIGERNFKNIKSFSYFKVFLQKLASLIISILTGNKFRDVTSGFRAYHKDYASEIRIYSGYTYTLENLIYASFKKKKITSILVETNHVFRKSRLIKNNFLYILISIITVLRTIALFRPFRFFLSTGLLLITFISIFNNYFNNNFIIIFYIIGSQFILTSFILDSINGLNKK